MKNSIELRVGLINNTNLLRIDLIVLLETKELP